MLLSEFCICILIMFVYFWDLLFYIFFFKVKCFFAVESRDLHMSDIGLLLVRRTFLLVLFPNMFQIFIKKKKKQN